MRIAVLAGVAIIVAAAFIVPVPSSVRNPGRLVPLPEPQVAVQLEGRAAGDLTGTYLGVAEQREPSLARAMVAMVRPDETLHAPAPLSDLPQERPANLSAVIGLGLSPARLPDGAMPVEVTLADSVDPASLASALQAFDATAPQDAAAGRTILAIGRVAPDLAVSCDGDMDESLAAARDQDVDLVIIPTGCAGSRARGRVVAVATLYDAVTALVEPDGG